MKAIGSPETASLVLRIKTFFKNAKHKRAVLGLSGGVDSAVVCALLSRALGSKNVFAYHLPAGDFAHLADAITVAEKFEVNFEAADLSGAKECMAKASAPKLPKTLGNISSRLRMAFLYAKANDLNALVAGTGNKSELDLGYFTKYGDGGCDVEPIGGLYKTQVYMLAKELGVPKEVIEKAPTAGLWAGQTDESELGAPYSVIDLVLDGLEKKVDIDALEKKFGKKIVQNLRKRRQANAHKNAKVPTL